MHRASVCSRIGPLARNVEHCMSDSEESVVFGVRLSVKREEWEYPSPNLV